MSTRPKTKRNQRIAITLSEKEGEWLSLYAKEIGSTRPAIIHRMVREGLRQYKAMRGGHIEPKNQLDLFDSIQVDIFNNTSKTEDPS